MRTLKIVYWQEGEGWIGYLQDYPDYWTQGDTLEDLKDQLRHLYKDVIREQPPVHHNVDELNVP